MLLCSGCVIMLFLSLYAGLGARESGHLAGSQMMDSNEDVVLLQIGSVSGRLDLAAD
eukprot:COSAG02_NODE_1666_length_11424_cov_5.733245_10_plen_57_part_00